MAVKVKIFANDGKVSTESNLIKIFTNFKIKVIKLVKYDEYFMVICASDSDTDILFSKEVQQALDGLHFKSIIPAKIKANRSIILKKPDSFITNNDCTVIKSEIERKNNWAEVVEVIKFKKSSGIKIVFSNTYMADKCINNGLFLFYLFIRGEDMTKDKFFEIKTCYRCYEFGSHFTNECKQSLTYKVCSLCASHDHLWKECKTPARKCINCGGDHATLSISCKLRQDYLTNVRNSDKKSFSEAVIQPVQPHPPPAPINFNNELIAKTFSCIVLASFKENEEPGSFEANLNNLFTVNNLPTLCLDGFSPPKNFAVLDCNVNSSTVKEQPKQQDGSSQQPGGDLTSNSAPVHDGKNIKNNDNKSVHFDKVTSIPSTQSLALNEKFKIFKKKDCKARTNKEMLSEWEKGNVVITHAEGNSVDYTTGSSLLNSGVNLTNLIVELKTSDFDNCRNSPQRFLRTKLPRASKLLNQ